MSNPKETIYVCKWHTCAHTSELSEGQRCREFHRSEREGETFSSLPCTAIPYIPLSTYTHLEEQLKVAKEEFGYIKNYLVLHPGIHNSCDQCEIYKIATKTLNQLERGE